uniref:C2H2-type domain-containing protein n=1 Tax=Oryzias sinensis TaxID=183150 RepID=A0A8C8DE04_9TELE
MHDPTSSSKHICFRHIYKQPNSMELTSEEMQEPEPPNIKEEPGELCISQDEEHLDLKQETDTLMEIPTYEEDENSEAYLNNQQSFNVNDSQDEEGNQHEESTSTTDEETESTSTTDEETDPQNRDQRKRRDRRYVQSVDSSHISEGRCDYDVRKNPKKTNLGKKHKQSDERCYICNECGKSFCNRSLFRIHTRIHAEGKRFSCKECNKSFSRISTLKTHMRIHTGEKPFSCKECKKSFSRISHLKTHMRTHTGEKPFSCKEYCKKSFNQLSNLKTHMRIHTGERPFSCKECKKKFSRIFFVRDLVSTHSLQLVRLFLDNVRIKCKILNSKLF